MRTTRAWFVIPSYPLKPHGFLSTLSAEQSFSLERPPQVVSTSWVKGLVLLITVAVILSSVSLLLIALYHLRSASLGVCCTSCITRSHLKTHIRWAASDTMIWRRRDAPADGLSVLSLFGLSASCLAVDCAVRQPHPRIVLMNSMYSHQGRSQG